jgi:hypothetical protein
MAPGTIRLDVSDCGPARTRVVVARYLPRSEMTQRRGYGEKPVSPDHESAKQGQGKNHQAKVQPDPVDLDVFRENEDVHDAPRTQCKAQRDPDKIVRCLEDGTKLSDLRARNTSGQYGQSDDEKRSKRQATQDHP